jgi:hypothetical protein
MKMTRDHLEALATALESKRGWAFDTLMTAAREVEAQRCHLPATTPREVDLDKSIIHQLECNLTDAACAYSKAKDKAHRAWLKHGRAAKAADKAERCLPPLGRLDMSGHASVGKGPVIQGVFDKKGPQS